MPNSGTYEEAKYSIISSLVLQRKNGDDENSFIRDVQHRALSSMLLVAAGRGDIALRNTANLVADAWENPRYYLSDDVNQAIDSFNKFLDKNRITFKDITVDAFTVGGAAGELSGRFPKASAKAALAGIAIQYLAQDRKRPMELSRDQWGKIDQKIQQAIHRYAQENTEIKSLLEQPDSINKWGFSLGDDMLAQLPNDLQKMLSNLDGQGALTPEDVAKAVEEYSKENLSHIASKVANELEARNAGQEPDQDAVQERIEFQQNLAAGVHLAQTFFQLTDNPEAAKYLGGGFEVYNQLNSLLSTDPQNLLTMASGYAGVAMFAASLLKKPKPDGFQVYVQNAFAQVFETLAVINKKLDVLLENDQRIMEQLAEMGEDIEDIDSQLDYLISRVEQISQKASIHHGVTKLIARANELNPYEDALEDLNSEIETVEGGGEYDHRDVKDALQKIRLLARASDDPEFTDYIAGQPSGIAIKDAIRNADERLNIDSQIGIVPSIRAFVGDGDVIPSQVVINPSTFALSAQGVAAGLQGLPQFAKTKPGYVKKGGQVHSIILRGSNFLENIHTLFDDDMIDALVAKYKTLARQVIEGAGSEGVQAESIIDEQYRLHKKDNHDVELYPHQPHWWARLAAPKSSVEPKTCISWQQIKSAIGAGKHGFVSSAGSIYSAKNDDTFGAFIPMDAQKTIRPSELAELGLLTKKRAPHNRDRFFDRFTNGQIEIPNGHSRQLHVRQDIFEMSIPSQDLKGHTFNWYQFNINNTQSRYDSQRKKSVRVYGVNGSKKFTDHKGQERVFPNNTFEMLSIIETEVQKHYTEAKEKFRSNLSAAFKKEHDGRLVDFFETAAALSFMGGLALWLRGENLETATAIARNPKTLFGSAEALSYLFDGVLKDVEQDGDKVDAKNKTLDKYIKEEMLKRISKEVTAFREAAFAEDLAEYAGPRPLNEALIDLEGIIELYR